jgi:hypothetical protein
MWALINPNDDTVETFFVRAQAFRLGDVNYPATAFKDKTLLAELNILPVRRVQLNAPEDTFGWTSSDEYVVELDHVRQEVTWTEDVDGPARRAQRDADRAAASVKMQYIAKRAFFLNWMAENFFYRETEMVGGDFLRFEADWAARPIGTP